MNPELANDLATCRLRDLRQLGERHRRQTPTTASRRHRPFPLRRRIGFRLVEAGLHLMGTAAE
jgi:hypothetical protein